MIFLSILIIIVAIALPSYKQNLSSLLISRISAIIFIYSAALAFNALYIQSIGSGIGIYSGLFHVTIISQLFDVILFMLGALILIAWPLIISSKYNKVLSFITLLKSKDGSSSFLNSLSLYKNNLNLSSVQDNNSKLWLNLYKISEFQKINIIGFYVPKTEYCLIILFSLLGSSLLISSSDLLSMYISIELQSFSLYILATLYKDYESSTASGLKYFLLGALSSCFILLGSGLIYTFTGLTNFESIYSLISSVSSSYYYFSSLNNINLEITQFYNIISGVSLGIILIFIGFLFKISAAPLHSWSPDVYDETPTQVTIWLTIIPKISILILLLELQSGFSINLIIDYNIYSDILTEYSIINNMFNISFNTSYLLKILLLISSLFSLIIGTIVGLAQTRIKRLLAYSTISHIGFILLALAINTEQSIDSFIFYIIQYSITNLNIFLIIIAFGYIINIDGIKITNYNYNNRSLGLLFFNYDIKLLKNLQSKFYFNPILSLCLIICLFSMAGVPPLLGFFSKQFVLLSAVQSGYWFMAFICILTSVISASYYLRFVILLLRKSEKKSVYNTNFNLNNEDLITVNKKKNNKIVDSTNISKVYADSIISPIIDNSNNNTLKTLSNYSSFSMDINPLMSILSLDKLSGLTIEKNLDKTTKNIIWPYNLLSSNSVGKNFNNEAPSLTKARILTNLHSFLISTLTLLILLFILKPTLILNSTQILALSLFNN